MQNKSTKKKKKAPMTSSLMGITVYRYILKIEAKGFVDRLDVVRDRERSQRDPTGWMRRPSQG